MTPSRRGHVTALDGVRGIALVIVVVHHATVRAAPTSQPIHGGWIGVDLFFVLSGFLITRAIVRRPDVGKFFRRRAWRIAPAMAVFLAAYVVWSVAAADDVRQRMRFALAAATQWTNVQGALGPPFSPHLGHLWSLSAEVQFYVAWGLLLTFLVRRRTPPSAIVAMLAVLFALSWIERAALWDHGTPWNRLYLGPDTHAASLLAGCMVGIAFASGWLRATRVIALLSVPAAATIGWQVANQAFLDGSTYRWGFSAAAASGAVVVASAATRAPSPLRPLMELWPFPWLGRISYSLYLWHLPIIAEVARHRPGDIAGTAKIAIPLSVLVGWLSYTFIERPFLTAANRRRLRARIT